ncbi:MAG: hypothetical protein ACLQAT_18595 [Candidatus Binataceae bacterium]
MKDGEVNGESVGTRSQSVGSMRRSVREGEIDPSLGKRVDTLIFQDDDVLVYLDEDLYVEWEYDEAKIQESEGWPGIFNRVSLLEAFQIDGLSGEIRTSFRRMIGEAVARLLVSRDVDAANQILDKAEDYVNARNLELARRWYVAAAGAISGFALIAAFTMWWSKGFVIEQLGKTAFDMLMGTCSGAVGASISLLLGIQSRPLDATAGKPAHLFAGITRVLTGMGGAALATLAVKVNVLGGFVAGTQHPFAALMLIGAIAGASERLVPDLITRIEGSFTERKSPASESVTPASVGTSDNLEKE